MSLAAAQMVHGDPRAATNPLFNDNRLKLGIFAANGSGGAMTTVPEQFQLTWPNTLDVAQEADRAGLEALVPYARWRSFVGPEHRSGRVFESLTWAAGLAAQTNYSAVMSTCHVPINHPLFVAKAAATIDAISNGRFALNIVCGWFETEIEMFNLSRLDHDERYRFADEWITTLKRLWSEDDYFDVTGTHVRIGGAISQPKPLQRPFPALMNAGGSEAGRQFVAKHCDIAFVVPRGDDPDALKRQVEDYRNLARAQSGREIQVWSSAFVALADTYADAVKYVDYYAVQNGDEAHVDAFIAESITRSRVIDQAALEKLRYAIKAGTGGIPLLGTPQAVAEKLGTVSRCGVDGILLVWMDYQNGVRQFSREVLPLLEQAGLRQPRAQAKTAPA
ncbi:MAG TPA: LLM class flavin-dependent oxidoreductase [Xanthobacteraceae bacterium]|jgi:alkanesulfonate monooxygenase SsuD/methylene tetrahydromethanopterin reductase-like flavin-dependent oxidoreductase (luciferase family)|nr:LLM class flavin-dependent oxidoreductase [Xanthobacteraceae bacterium]